MSDLCSCNRGSCPICHPPQKDCSVVVHRGPLSWEVRLGEDVVSTFVEHEQADLYASGLREGVERGSPQVVYQRDRLAMAVRLARDWAKQDGWLGREDAMEVALEVAGVPRTPVNG